MVDMIENNKTVDNEQEWVKTYKYNYELFRMYFWNDDWSF